MAEAKKRIVFCTYSSVYSSLVLKRLLSDEGVEVVGIINSTRVISPEYGFIRGALAQVNKSGWRYSGYLFLVTDLFAGLKPAKTIHGLAKKNDIPLLDTLDINGLKSLDFIQEIKADSLLAAHFNQLIKKPLLDMKCLNIHPSLLPAFKGVDPVFYALLENQPIGVTLHEMAESFDTGDILLQKNCSLESSATVFSANCKLFDVGAAMALTYLHSPNQPKLVQNKSDEYDSWPRRADISQFRRLGKRLIKLPELWRYLFGGRV
ncbi:MAG: formyltransferase family protein [Cocleimonas sp.]